MRRPQLRYLALRTALVPAAAVVPGTALSVLAYELEWPGGVIAGCALVAALPMIAMWLVVDATIVWPLRAILRAIYRLTEGDFSARSGAGGPTELDAVMRALDDLAGRLDAVLTRARAAERRYRRLFENNPAGMFRTRARDGRVFECNLAAVRMLGYASVLEAQTHRAETFYANPLDRTILLDHLRTHDVITASSCASAARTAGSFRCC